MNKGIVNQNGDGKCEVRCRVCGRLLFAYEKKKRKNVDGLKTFGIIVTTTRCPRCKSDNRVDMEL